MTALFQECLSFARALASLHREEKAVVFYSERAGDFKYFEGIFLETLERSSVAVYYLTSDPLDPMLADPAGRWKGFYFGWLLPLVLLFLNRKVLVMTLPDLDRYHIRRSVRGVQHVYVFHALVSTHMVYRFGAFDHYDTVLCAGPHQVAELRRAEEIYGLPPKRLAEVGYPWLDRLIAVRKRIDESASSSGVGPKVLIAPSWGRHNILESCLEEITAPLSRLGYSVVIRPHPQWVRQNPREIKRISRQFGSRENVEVDLGPLSDQALMETDVLVTDWSGIALEYAFAAERPVLFIDVPSKVNNPRHEELGMTPLEMRLRNRIGKVVTLQAVDQIDREIRGLIERRDSYRDCILKEREQAVFHLGRSSSVGAQFILDLCQSL